MPIAHDTNLNQNDPKGVKTRSNKQSSLLLNNLLLNLSYTATTFIELEHELGRLQITAPLNIIQ